MERFDIFKDISERTGGDIYWRSWSCGQVSPLLSRDLWKIWFYRILTIHMTKRALDELPKWRGKTVTTEPKFVPDEAIPQI